MVFPQALVPPAVLLWCQLCPQPSPTWWGVSHQWQCLCPKCPFLPRTVKFLVSKGLWAFSTLNSPYLKTKINCRQVRTPENKGEFKARLQGVKSIWQRREKRDEFSGSRAISESTQASCHSVKSQCTSTRSEIGLHSLLCVYEFVKADLF